MFSQFPVIAEEEIPPVALDPGIVNNLNREIMEELIEKEEEPEEGNSEEKKVPEFESLKRVNYKEISNKITSENENFNIEKVIFEGNTIFKQKDLYEYVKPLIGKNISGKDISDAIENLNKMFEDNGYYTTYACLTKEPKNNTLVINIVEGKIGQINIEGNKYSKKFYLKSVLLASDGLQENKVFNVNNVNKALEDINSKSYMKAKISVDKDENSDNSNLNLKLAETRPLSFKIMWDNDGNELVGQNRAMMLLSKENLFGLGNQIYGGTVLAKGTTGALAGYKMPVGKYGTQLQFDYSFTHVNLLDDYETSRISGNAQTFSTRVFQPLYNKKNTEISTDLGIDFVRVDSMQYEEYKSLNDYKLTVLRHGINYTKRDESGIFLSRLESSFGIPILGATDNTTSYFNNDTNEPQSAFYKVKFHLMRLQRLPKDCLGIFRVTAQYSPNNLFATEQMNFGGLSTMRGFEPGETLADSGVNGTLEVRTPVPFLKRILPEKIKKVSDRIKLGFFYDWGVFSNQNTGVEMSGVANFLQSIGCGIHFKITDNMTASWEMGVPVGSSIHKGKSAVMYFAVKADLWNLLPKKNLAEKL